MLDFLCGEFPLEDALTTVHIRQMSYNSTHQIVVPAEQDIDLQHPVVMFPGMWSSCSMISAQRVLVLA